LTSRQIEGIIMSIKIVARFAFAITLIGVTTSARADVQVGLLSCRSVGGTSYVIVSNQPFTCVFTPRGGGPVQYYQATIRSVGAQLGYNNDVSLGWAVFAPTLNVGPGALTGVYGGLSAGAAIGVGVGANGLVGGNNSFALQPVSVESQSGLNLVAAATELELQAAPVAVHYIQHHRHHH
jgi:hypothetical protein